MEPFSTTLAPVPVDVQAVEDEQRRRNKERRIATQQPSSRGMSALSYDDRDADASSVNDSVGRRPRPSPPTTSPPPHLLRPGVRQWQRHDVELGDLVETKGSPVDEEEEDRKSRPSNSYSPSNRTSRLYAQPHQTRTKQVADERRLLNAFSDDYGMAEVKDTDMTVDHLDDEMLARALQEEETLAANRLRERAGIAPIAINRLGPAQLQALSRDNREKMDHPQIEQDELLARQLQRQMDYQNSSVVEDVDDSVCQGNTPLCVGAIILAVIAIVVCLLLLRS